MRLMWWLFLTIIHWPFMYILNIYQQKSKTSPNRPIPPALIIIVPTRPSGDHYPHVIIRWPPSPCHHQTYTTLVGTLVNNTTTIDDIVLISLTTQNPLTFFIYKVTVIHHYRHTFIHHKPQLSSAQDSPSSTKFAPIFITASPLLHHHTSCYPNWHRLNPIQWFWWC